MRAPLRQAVLRSSLALALAAAVAGCSTPQPVPARLGIPVPADAQEAVVVRVVDGDTLQLRGRGVGPLPADRTRVRVLLIDTPEVHIEQECLGEQAYDRAEQLLPEGSTVRVLADRDPEDRFGRSLLHVWNADGVNEVLVVRPNELWLEQFEAAEREASEASRGLWAACR